MTSSHWKSITLLACGVVLFWTACKKPTLEGTGTLPDSTLGLTVVDTLELLTYTEADDTVRADEQSVNILGTLNDPELGTSKASIFMNFTLDRSNIDLGSSLTADSMVLTLLYTGSTASYGDVSTPQNISVHRVTDRMYIDSLYYNNTTFGYDASPIAQVNGFVPNLTDSLLIDGVTYGPGLRINLDNSLAQEFLAQSGGTNLATDAAFKDWFNGLYLTTDAVGNGQVYFDIFNSMSKLTLYYNDTSQIDFLINSSSASVNNYTHDFSTGNVNAHLDDTTSNDLMYVKAMGGTRGIVKVPGLQALGNKISINEAKLTVTVVNPDTATYGISNQMIITLEDADGEEQFVPELVQFSNLDFFDGELRTDVDGSGATVQQYVFNLPIYFQQIVNGEEDRGLRLLTFPTSRQSDRVILGGSAHAEHAVELHLVYTKTE